MPSDNKESSAETLANAAALSFRENESSSNLSADLALFLANPSLRAALTDGSLDLQSYSETVNQELAVLESQCIAAYRAHASEITALQEDMQHSRTVLAAVREMLLGFQADLGGLSGDIRQLQEKSQELDIQLTNRRAAEQSLRGYLERIVIAPSVANAILTGPVNSTQFVESVQEIQGLYKNCCSEAPEDWSSGMPVTETVSGREMKKELETLRMVAVKRSREFMLEQMALLRRPQTNVRILQVHGLLKYAALLDFLEEMGYAHEIVSIYCKSMRSTLLSLFTNYSQQLLQLDLTKIVCTRTATVIAIDDVSLRTERSRTHQRLDVFCLGTRATDCLGADQQHPPQPIAAHIASMQKEQYPYERLFQSLLGHLVDAVTNEHVFCRRFFQRDAFGHLFPNTLSLLTEHLENYLFTCHDAVCLLLMVSVTHMYRRLAQQRKIRSLDSFFGQITKLLWPRLKTVMDGHLRSIQTADAAQLGSVDLHAHYVSRRFGEFCCSLLLILHSKARTTSSSSASSSSSRTPVRGSLARQKSEDMPNHHQSAGSKLLEDISELIDAFVLLLERLAESKHTTQKKRTVFLINNLDHIVCIFQERRVTGKECSKIVETLIQYRERFVEEELLTGFSKMIAFVQQTELHIQQQGPEACDINPAVVESLLMDFTNNWKSHMEQINKNVLSYFSNFRNGMEILKHCLTQLLLYYTRFQEILRKVWKKSQPAFTKELVPTNVILSEIKKYALAL